MDVDSGLQTTFTVDPGLLSVLPDALADALAMLVAECRRETTREIERHTAETRAVLAELKAENAELRSALRERVDAEIVRLSAFREPQDGRSPTEDELLPLIERAVARRLEAIPLPDDGKPGPPGQDGRDGKDAPAVSRDELLEVVIACDDVIDAAVQRYFEAHPPAPGPAGTDGRDGVDGKDAPTVTEEQLRGALDLGVKQWLVEHPPERGERGEPGEPGKAGERGEKGIDGRDGRDGLAGASGLNGEKGMDGRDGKDGRDGIDGMGLEDLTLDYDGERTLTARLERGDLAKEWKIKWPIPIDRGIWREGFVAETADIVGFGGSAWVAIRDTAEKPDMTAKDWRLMVKKGRDGKDGVMRGPQGPVKLGS